MFRSQKKQREESRALKRSLNDLVLLFHLFVLQMSLVRKTTTHFSNLLSATLFCSGWPYIRATTIKTPYFLCLQFQKINLVI